MSKIYTFTHGRGRRTITYEKYSLEMARDLLDSIPDQAQRAVPRALKRAMIRGRYVAKSGVLDTYTIKSRDVDEFTKTFAYRDEAGFYMRSFQFSKERFKVRPTDPSTTGRNHKLVRVQIRKDGPMQKYEFAFKHQGHIFERVWVERLPLLFHRGPSLKGMVSGAKVADDVMEEMEKTFNERLEHEIDWALNGRK